MPIRFYLREAHREIRKWKNGSASKEYTSSLFPILISSISSPSLCSLIFHCTPLSIRLWPYPCLLSQNYTALHGESDRSQLPPCLSTKSQVLAPSSSGEVSSCVFFWNQRWLVFHVVLYMNSAFFLLFQSPNISITNSVPEMSYFYNT